jgi:hypothetical protein
MLLKRQFKPLLQALGIKVPRGDGFYILRHENATLMSSFFAPQNLRQMAAQSRRRFAGHRVGLHARD